MGERTMRIVFSSSISDLTEKNSSFVRGILRVAYTGRNRNNSFISKETFERCMPSIYNCPIVCRYDREEDVIGSHDMELVSDGDGGLRIVNITHPVGVIPESAQYWWEEIEDDSEVHEYLCVDALIWKRQEAYKKIKEDGITDESMEISIKEGEMVDGVYVIHRFEFTAFCLLGTAQPCYESASLEMFSCDDFKRQLADMMQELKESFQTVQPSHEVVIHPQNYSEGGEEVLEQKKALAAEYGLDIESLDFSIDDLSVEELREKFEAMKEQPVEPSANPDDPSESFALEGQFREELYGALDVEKIETCWGVDSRYWLWDYDKDVSEVYATDVSDWNIYGFTYSMDGDHVVIDFASKKRMKIAIVPFDEGSQSDPISGMFAKVVEKYTANDTQWDEKYQAASDTISSMQTELDALRQFKTDTESAAAKEEREKVFAQFEDLVGVEAFDALRESNAEYSIEELEEKCYAIRGRTGAPAKFSYEQKTPKLAVEKTSTTPEPYGGVFAEYGIVLRNQHN